MHLLGQFLNQLSGLLGLLNLGLLGLLHGDSGDSDDSDDSLGDNLARFGGLLHDLLGDSDLLGKGDLDLNDLLGLLGDNLLFLGVGSQFHELDHDLWRFLGGSLKGDNLHLSGNGDLDVSLGDGDGSSGGLSGGLAFLDEDNDLLGFWGLSQSQFQSGSSGGNGSQSLHLLVDDVGIGGDGGDDGGGNGSEKSGFERGLKGLFGSLLGNLLDDLLGLLGDNDDLFTLLNQLSHDLLGLLSLLHLEDNNSDLLDDSLLLVSWGLLGSNLQGDTSDNQLLGGSNDSLDGDLGVLDEDNSGFLSDSDDLLGFSSDLSDDLNDLGGFLGDLGLDGFLGFDQDFLDGLLGDGFLGDDLLGDLLGDGLNLSDDLLDNLCDLLDDDLGLLDNLLEGSASHVLLDSGDNSHGLLGDGLDLLNQFLGNGGAFSGLLNDEFGDFDSDGVDLLGSNLLGLGNPLLNGFRGSDDD